MTCVFVSLKKNTIKKINSIYCISYTKFATKFNSKEIELLNHSLSVFISMPFRTINKGYSLLNRSAVFGHKHCIRNY